MTIIVVEDDHLEVERLTNFFEKRMGAKVISIATEGEFVAKLDQIAATEPNIVIMDVMLRWADPSPYLKMEDVPPDVLSQGFYTAGIRCMKRLKERPDTTHIPVILYTALDQNDFKENIVHTKGDNLELLYEEINKRLHADKHR